MLKNLDGLGEQAINRIATAALASQMRESESFSVNVKVDPQELSKGIISSFAMEGKNVVTSQGFRATDFSLLIENISVHPFKALMGNVQLREPAFGNALLEVGATDLEDALSRKLNGVIPQGFMIQTLSCGFDLPNVLQVKVVLVEQSTSDVHGLDARFVVGYDINQKAIAFQSSEYSENRENFDRVFESLGTTLLDLLNLNGLMFSGMEFSVKSIKLTDSALELMAIAKITSFPKAI
ncbi:hypothetical protein NIES208_15675 [[Limnothrix rosea] IAM M-220]|nr:hypothetical protein NIES208_15675 [[Limnothrix rosea] IAM M-220]